MEYLPVVFLSLLILILVLSVVRSVTVFIHELGHAIPALILTKGKVEIFIGSYGDPKNSLILNIGRLKINFKYNPYLWNLGLVTHKGTTNSSLIPELIIILSGPLFSLIFGFAICFLAYSYGNSERIHVLGFIVLASSLIDFYQNIVPHKKPIQLHNGNIVFNDGTQIKQIIEYRIYSNEYFQASQYYNEKKYGKAGDIFLSILEKGYVNHLVFQFTIVSFIQQRKYIEAETIFDNFKNKTTLDSIDYSNLGLIYSQLGKVESCFLMFKKALDMNPNNTNALNNRGFQYNLDSRFEEAIIDFNKVIELDKDFAYALNNRGHSKIELGLVEEGLEDIRKSLEIAPDNSYAYRNLGIYYLKREIKKEALENLNRALDLDIHTYGIEDLIKEANAIQ